MANRFGRNQRRKLLARIRELQYHELSTEAVHLMREYAMNGLGFNCTFVDDNMQVIVGLAQRAVLARLDSDAQPDMQRRFREAAEPWRERHEKALGRPIGHS